MDVNGTLGVSGASVFTSNVKIIPSLSNQVPLVFDTRLTPTFVPQISFILSNTGRYQIHSYYNNTDGYAYHELASNSNFEIGLDGGSFIVGDSNFPVTTKAFEVKNDAETYLTHNKNKKLETTGYGVTVTGGINITNRVGINSASPEASISLVGESGSASYLNFRENGTNNERVVIDQYGQLGLDVNTANIGARLHIATMADNGIIVEDMFGTTLFTVNGDDRVGIGMTDPASMLGVKGDVTVGDGSDQSRTLLRKQIITHQTIFSSTTEQPV